LSNRFELVTWDAPHSMGKILGSDWDCPTNFFELRVDARASGVSDRELLPDVVDRRQHLEMDEYPEGYPAVRIVDSNTGKNLRDVDANYGYARTRRDDGILVVPILEDRPIPAMDGRDITEAYNHAGRGTTTVVRPHSAEPQSEPWRRYLDIAPQKRLIEVRADGDLKSVEGAKLSVSAAQEHGHTTGHLDFWLNPEGDSTGELAVQLYGSGRVNRVWCRGRGFLKALGVNTENLDLYFSHDDEYEPVMNAKDRRLILGAAAEALGLDRWRQLDLRLTASGLYKVLGQPDLDPSTALVSRA